MKEKRILTAIVFNTEHYLANLLALTKVLNINLTEARKLVKGKIGETITLTNPLVICSKYTTDQIYEELEKDEIKVTIINQQL